MPSWRKVILSGSNAALNSLNVTTSITASTVSASSFTGSLLGTASLANNIFIDSTTISAPFPVLFELTPGRVSKDSGGTDFSYNPNTNTLNVGNILGTASWAQSASNAVNARTASFVNNLNQNLSITGAVVLSGSSQPELRVIGETQFTGSVNSLNGFTGSLFGTSSWANTASVALNLPPGTYNITSSWARNSLTSSLSLLSSHSWTITDGTNSEIIGYNTAVTFSGEGGTTVGYTPNRNELAISSKNYIAGTALDLTLSGPYDATFDVDLTELTNSTTITSSNSFVIISGSNQRLISASLIGLNIFNNNLTLFNSPITASIISASGGITGSLLGTSSWAQNSSTSSISSFVTIDSVSLPGPFPILFESATGRVAKDSGSVDFGFSPANNVLIVGTVSASNGFTGSLFGTSSWAQRSISSSFSNLVNISNNVNNRILTAGGPGNVINAEEGLTFTGTDLILTGSYVQDGAMTVNNSIGKALSVTKESMGSTVVALGDINNIVGSGTHLIVNDTDKKIYFRFDGASVYHTLDETDFILNGNLTAGVDPELSNHSITGQVVITGSAEVRGNLTVSNITSTSKLTGSFISNNGNNRVVTSNGDGTFTAESGLTYTPGLLNVSGNINITGSLTAGTGSFNTVNAQVLNVTYVSSSVVYSSGSNIFGSSSANTQTLIGNVVVTGSSFTWNGNTVITTANTASMTVLSASYASSSTSASYASSSTSASYASSSTSASYASSSTSASYASSSTSASYASSSTSASYASSSTSASYASSSTSASYASSSTSASYASSSTSASYASSSTSASYASSSTSASYASSSTSASYASSSTSASYASSSTSASYASSSTSASYASSSTSASYASSSTSASYASSSTSASYASSSTSASYALSASHALTASYVNPLRQNVLVTGSIKISGSITASGYNLTTPLPLIFNSPSSSAGTPKDQSFVVKDINYPVRLYDAFQNYNDNRYYDAILSNRFHGRSDLIAISINGTAYTTNATLFNGAYEGSYGGNANTSASYKLDFIERGLTPSSSGFSYPQGQVHATFYDNKTPLSMSMEYYYRDEVGGPVITSSLFSFIPYDTLDNATTNRFQAWRVNISPTFNYIIGLTIFVTASSGWPYQFTEIEYYGTRATYEENGNFSREGGYVKTINVRNNATITGSLNVSSSITSVGTITSTAAGTNLIGTASWAVSSSRAISASQATTASYVLTAQTASYVLNAISSSFASTASFVRNAQTASYVNPLTQSVLITGSLSITGSTSITSGTLSVYKSSSTVVDVQGSQGSLLRVTDILSGSLFSVGDISGLPILEVLSDDTVIAGGYNQYDLIVTGSKVGIGTSRPTDKLTVSGSVNSITQRLTASHFSIPSSLILGSSPNSGFWESGLLVSESFTVTDNTTRIAYIDPKVINLNMRGILYITSASVIYTLGNIYNTNLAISSSLFNSVQGTIQSNQLLMNYSPNASSTTAIAFSPQFLVDNSNSTASIILRVPDFNTYTPYTCSAHIYYEIIKR